MLEILPSVGIFHQNVKPKREGPDEICRESNKILEFESNTLNPQHQDTESGSSNNVADVQAQPTAPPTEDELVSWSVLKHQGDMGMTVTKPQHRRKGLAVITALTLLQQVQNDGCHCLVKIISDNAVSLKMAKDTGFQCLGTSDIVNYELQDGH